MDLNYDQFNGDALIFKYNLDEYGNPISIKVDKEEKQVSVHGTIQLEYVPDEYNRVVILNEDNTQMTEVFNRDEIKPNTYYVDYNNGVVYLDKSQFGKTKIYNYYKKGLQLIGCSRIYDEHDVSGKHVVLTLQEIIDAGREALRFLLDIGDAKKVIELLESLIAEGKLTITNLENKKNECIQSINNAISQATQDKNEIVQEIQDNIQQAKDEVVNVAGNKEVIIRSSDWALNIDVYEKEISHNLNSENLHVTAKNSDTKEAVTIGYKILDKTRILLKSDEAINMSVILSASYYHATQTISDDIAEEVVKARKGEASLDVKITKIDEQLEQNITDINNKINDLSTTLTIRSVGIQLENDSEMLYFISNFQNNLNKFKEIGITDVMLCPIIYNRNTSIELAFTMNKLVECCNIVKNSGLKLTVKPHCWGDEFSSELFNSDSWFGSYKNFLIDILNIGVERIGIMNETPFLTKDDSYKSEWENLCNYIKLNYKIELISSPTTSSEYNVLNHFCDYICFNCYPSNTINKPVCNLGDTLLEVYKYTDYDIEGKYKNPNYNKKKIFITECGIQPYEYSHLHPWEWETNPLQKYNEDVQAIFYEDMIGYVESTDWITGISWWISGSDDTTWTFLDRKAESIIKERWGNDE